MFVHNQCYFVDGFEIRLVPARKCSAGIGRVELSGGDLFRLTGCVFVCASIKTPQLLADCAFEAQVQCPQAGLEDCVKTEASSFIFAIERNLGYPGVTTTVFNLRFLDLKVKSI